MQSSKSTRMLELIRELKIQLYLVLVNADYKQITIIAYQRLFHRDKESRSLSTLITKNKFSDRNLTLDSASVIKIHFKADMQ